MCVNDVRLGLWLGRGLEVVGVGARVVFELVIFVPFILSGGCWRFVGRRRVVGASVFSVIFGVGAGWEGD